MIAVVADTKNRSQHAVEAHRKSVALSTADIASFLQDTLGAKLTAYIADVSDPKMVGKWANGTKPAADRERRLRDAHQIFQTIMAAEDEYVARAWFIGMNPNLEDQTPADVLREGRARDVMAAARTYADGS